VGIALIERDYADADALARALAQAVAGDLRAGIAARGGALLALSGGTTPRRFLDRLGRQTVDWARVTITLTDERCVPPADARSNQRLLRETLLRGAAAAARFVPLDTAAPNREIAFATIAANVAKLPLPFDAVVLGMGTDGHCASLFADGDRIDAALRSDGIERIVPMYSPSAGEPRVTLSLSALLATRALYLHIEGDTKRNLLTRIVRGEAPFTSAPIAAVLSQSAVTPVRFWCP
jgi:6-phosphogluconolactonase